MKMRLNLATRDLDAVVAFYRTLLLAEPAKNQRTTPTNSETSAREGATRTVLLRRAK